MIFARTTDLVQRYGAVTALDGVSIDIHAGELVGLLGPNGAGKSTLIKLLTGLRRPSAGTVELFGGDPHDPARRQQIGTTPQDTGLPETLRVREVIDYVAAHFTDPMSRDELLERFDLTTLHRRQTGSLSGGQKRRLAVGLAFVGRPRMVLLDEPTTGLDVEARHSLWQAIRTFHDDGGTVLLTSHYLEEVEALAKRVVVIGSGKVLADDSMTAIRGQVGVQKVSYLGLAPVAVDGIIDTRSDGERTELLTADADQLIRDLVGDGVAFRELAISQASLEDAFLSLTAA